MDPARHPVRSARSRRAQAIRHHGVKSPQAEEAARDLTAANAEAYIRELLDKAPKLTDQQRIQLAELLRPAREAIKQARLAEQLDGGAA